MRFIQSSNFSPQFNLAAEEYLIKNYDIDFCFVYQNHPSVIVGKHQNINAEINHAYIFKKRIEIVRRISGGGAVYHDTGNLNISIITQRKEGVDFISHIQLIGDVLKRFKLDIKLLQKSNAFVNDYKISGNAAHVWKNRIMHHGTLLFQTDLNALKASLSNNYEKYQGKSTKSQESEVINLSQLGLDNMNLFIDYLRSEIGATNFSFSQKEIKAIKLLSSQKYSNIKWNFGYSPAYNFKNSIEFENHKKADITLSVKRGIIEKFIYSNKRSKLLKEYENILIGQYHNWEIFKNIFKKHKFPQRLNTNLSTLLKSFF